MFLNKNRIVITGGTGRFGLELQKIKSSYKLFFPSKKELNILKLKSIQTYLKLKKPKYLIHLAGLSRPMKMHESFIKKSIDLNIIGTANITKVCSDLDIKLIYFSTGYVYPGFRGNYKESDPLLPNNNYSWSKLVGESSVRMYKNSLILRVNLKFSKEFSPILSYPSLSDYLVTNNINPSSITPRALINSIKTIREFKLPDPSKYPNAGSIFKNPIVKTNSIDSNFLSGHKWEVSSGSIKLSAARLIELIIDKILIPSTLAIYENHSLVIINLGDATYSEVRNLISDIQDLVKLTFNINLEIEPKIL